MSMDFGAIYHRSSDNYCYPLNKESLVINLKTGYDIEKVFLHYGDPFKNGIMGDGSAWDGKREEIIYKKHLRYHKWWTTTVMPEFKRCRYYFELITKGKKTFYYFEDRIYSEIEMKEVHHGFQYFTFPWMNEVDINKTPSWVNETIWYQIFPERFCNGDSSINPECVEKWAGPNIPVTNKQFFGGDLRGIINKLPYLKSLNISGIYLTPINESPSTHKYDTTDYFKIDPHFGDAKVMKELVLKAHALGMRVMLDGVFNHAGRLASQWQDVVQKGPDSPYYNWFMVNEWPFDSRGGNAHQGKYYSFAFDDKMPKLNTSEPEVRAYLISICEYWVKEYDIDGLRLDVANEVSHRFCKELRSRMKALKPDLYILGEVWNDSIHWLRGDEFDAVMNYPLGEAISDFWLEESYTKKDFEEAINRCYTLYMQQTNDVLFNLLDSHDTIRLSTKIPDKDKIYQQLAILYTMPGSPCIFYGTEVLLEGAHDPDCRRCMPWKEIEEGKYEESLHIVRQLTKLRKEEPLFRSRNFHFTNEVDNGRVLEYIKTDDYDRKKMAVILNCCNEVIKLKIEGRVLFSHRCAEGQLEPKGIVIWIMNEKKIEKNN